MVEVVSHQSKAHIKRQTGSEQDLPFACLGGLWFDVNVGGSGYHKPFVDVCGWKDEAVSIGGK